MADHDFDEVDEDVEQSAERVPRSPRLLIITLSVGCVALAISNIALATRVTQMRRAAVVDRPAVARAPIETQLAASEHAAPEPAAPAASIPSQTAPRVAPAPEASAPADPAPISVPSTPERETIPVAAAPEPVRPERASAELPPRPAPRAQQRVASAQRTRERAAPVPSTPERATASWMVQEYGRLDAEARARTAADFYGGRSPEGAYWRRVLGEIVTTRR